VATRQQSDPAAPRWRLPSSRTCWLFVWLAIAVFLVSRAGSRRESRGVIVDHLEFGRRLLHGEDVFGPWRSDPDAPIRPLHAPYPPSFGLLTAPFHVVADVAGQRAARIAWALLQMGCLVATALALRRRAPPGTTPANTNGWHWLWLALFLIGLRFVLRDTHGGGGNLITLGLCALAFDAAERDRPRLAGLLLGFSLATKPTQLWLVPVLLLLGFPRAVRWTLVTGAVAVFVTTVLQRFDVAPWLRWIEGTWRFSTQSDPFAVPALEFPPFEWMNQSLRCALARWLGEVPPEFARKVTPGLPEGLGLGIDTVAWIARLASAGLLGWLFVAALRSRRVAAARPFVFAAALVASVLLSPISWKAHHVALLPVLFLLLLDFVRTRRGLPLLVGWAVCCVPGGDLVEGLVGKGADDWMNSTYVVTAWDVVLFGWALRRAAQARSTTDEHRDAALPHGVVEVGR